MTSIFDKLFGAPSSQLQSEYPENEDFEITEPGMSTASTSTIAGTSQTTAIGLAAMFKKLLEGEDGEFEGLDYDYDDDLDEDMAETEAYMNSSSNYVPSYFGLNPGFNHDQHRNNIIMNSYVEEIEPRFLPHDHEERLLADKMNDLSLLENAYSNLFATIPTSLQQMQLTPSLGVTIPTYDTSYNPAPTLVQHIINLNNTQNKNEYFQYRFLDEDDENEDSYVGQSPKPSTSKGLGLKESTFNALKDSEIELKSGILKSIKVSSSNQKFPSSKPNLTQEAFRKSIRLCMESYAKEEELTNSAKTTYSLESEAQPGASEGVHALNSIHEILETPSGYLGQSKLHEAVKTISETKTDTDLTPKEGNVKFATTDSSCQTDSACLFISSSDNNDNRNSGDKEKQGRVETKKSGVKESLKKHGGDAESKATSFKKSSKGTSCWRIFRSGHGKAKKSKDNSSSESDSD